MNLCFQSGIVNGQHMRLSFLPEASHSVCAYCMRKLSAWIPTRTFVNVGTTCGVYCDVSRETRTAVAIVEGLTLMLARIGLAKINICAVSSIAYCTKPIVVNPKYDPKIFALFCYVFAVKKWSWFSKWMCTLVLKKNTNGWKKLVILQLNANDFNLRTHSVDTLKAKSRIWQR